MAVQRHDVVELPAALEAQRDVLLGLLLDEARATATRWGAPFDVDACRTRLLAVAARRPGRDPRADRLRALGRGEVSP